MGGPTMTVLASGSPDSGGAFDFGEDAGSEAGSVFLSSCTPGVTGSCPTGFTCYPTHTSTSWWMDLYGKCTFGCSAQTLALCSSFDGVCGCPVATDGTSDCSLEGGAPSGSVGDAGVEEGGSEDASEAPAPITANGLVCVPALKPGTQPGSNEGNGGCGTPGCGGGEEAGALPEDAGSSDAGDSG